MPSARQTTGSSRAPGSTAGSRRWSAPVALALALTALLAGPNVPTPLYPIYEHALGFSPLKVTLVFAAYALVLIPSLLVFGSASDVLGRRRVLLPAILVAALGVLLFIPAAGPGWMIAARVAQGLALGAAQGTATAALSDNDPDGDHARAFLIGVLGVLGGIALGPLLGGLLAQYAPAPLVLPYAVEAALLLLALAATACTLPRACASSAPSRGSTALSRPRHAWRPRRPGIPAAIRRDFTMAGLSAFVAFAVSALFLTLMPSVVEQIAHSNNLALGGGVAALMLGCAMLAQLPVRRLQNGQAQVIGLALMALGLGGVIVAVAGASLGVVLAASIVTGTGQGLVFGGSLAAVGAAAPAERRGDVLSSYYVTVYLGLAVPVIGAGLVASAAGQRTATQLFAAIIAVTCLAAIVVHRRDARRDAARAAH